MLTQYWFEVIILVVGIGVGGLQWFMKEWVRSLQATVKEIQDNQKDIVSEVHEIKQTYVPRMELTDMRLEIMTKLNSIEIYLRAK